jgi:hypothetical protein
MGGINHPNKQGNKPERSPKMDDKERMLGAQCTSGAVPGTVEFEWVNLTPHEINFRPAANTGLCERTIPSVGSARLNSSVEAEGIIRQRRLGCIVGLPEPTPGCIFIASSMVADAANAAGRTDVVAPAGDIRDAQGRIIGTSYFVQNVRA